MGYESRLYVCNKSSMTGISGKIWYEDIATFNLSKASEVSAKMRKYPATNGFVFADDGNTEIIEDDYGDPLKEIPLEEAIEILREASSESRYRRYKPCLELLRGFDRTEWGRLVVLHYGY